MLTRKCVEYLMDQSKYKFIFDYEWEVCPGNSNAGVGDLIMHTGYTTHISIFFFKHLLNEITRDGYNFLVVEVKFLQEGEGKQKRTSRCKSRTVVHVQAVKYSKAFKKSMPNALSVISLTYTNMGMPPKLNFYYNELLIK
jgi:hypothetical protein